MALSNHITFKITAFAALLALAMTLACTRQPAVESLDDSDPDNPQLPFERSPNRTGIPPTSAIRFQGIPAGTPVTIRLQSALSSEASRAHDDFQAVLDEPIIVQGKIVVPRGAPVGGRVVAARSSDGAALPGYLRLTLSTIAVNGKSWKVETNSIFAKGGARKHPLLKPTGGLEVGSNQQITEPGATPDVQFLVGDRFTFRLKETAPSQG